MWFWELRETLGVKATPRPLLAPPCWWSWPRLFTRWWRKVTNTCQFHIYLRGDVRFGHVTHSHTLPYQMGSGPEGVSCLRAGVLESMEALAPPSGWRLGLHVSGCSCQTVLLCKCSPCFSGLYVFHQSESLHLHQPGRSRHGSVSLSCRLSLYWNVLNQFLLPPLLTRSWALRGLGESAALQPPWEHHERGKGSFLKAGQVLLQTVVFFVNCQCFSPPQVQEPGGKKSLHSMIEQNNWERTV